MPPIVRFLLNNIELVFIALIILSSLFSLVGRIGRATQEAQREAERQRQRGLEQGRRREGNPNTQSYQGYLERTRPDKLERADDGRTDLFPSQSGTLAADVTNAGGLTEQERLRREMARKMGRTLPTPTTAQVPSRPGAPKSDSTWTELLRELSEAFDQGQPDTFGQPTKPEQPKPKPKPKPRPAAASQPQIESRLDQAMQPAQSTTRQTPQQSTSDPGTARAPKSAQAGPSLINPGRFNPQDVTRAIVWAEILGPPRSRRR